MKYFKICVITVLIALCSILWGDISVSIHQRGDSVDVRLEPIDLGAYILICGCAGETLMPGIVVDSALSIDFEIPACGSLTVRWTSIETVSVADVVPLDDYKVRIPGGWFRIGADVGDTIALVNSGADAAFINGARPDKWIFVDTFTVRTIEEPCSLYQQFIDYGGYSEQSYWKLHPPEVADPADSLIGWLANIWSGPATACTEGMMPVRGVSLYEALAYAHWQFGGTLPTEAEWEIVTRMNTGRIFPWGDVFCIPDYILTANVGDAIQCDSDPFAGGPGYPEFFTGDISASGCMSLSGNLVEWCIDRFESNYYGLVNTISPVLAPSSGENSAVRGGNFNTGHRYRASVFARAGFAHDSRQPHLGFRIVWRNSNGVPDEWLENTYTFDSSAPDTLGLLLPHGCLMDWVIDSFAIVFGEPVSGSISITPDDPLNIYPRWNAVPGETLWIVKLADVTVPGDLICIDISGLTDTVGNPLDIIDPICVPLCGTCIEIIQIPDTLWSPQGCYAQAELQIVNCSMLSMTIDSIITYLPFEILGDISAIAADETASVYVRFTPECTGIISAPIIVYGDFGIYSDSLLGYGCDEPLATAQPLQIAFGEICDTMCLDFQLIMNGCSEGMLEICDIYWTEDVNFNLNGILIGDTLYDSLSGQVCFDSLERGNQYDTLYFRFRPMGGVCCDNATISIPLSASCFGTACDPNTDIDAVLGNGTNFVEFSCIVEDVNIFDRWGRFVRKLEPDNFGVVEWDLTDKDRNLVPAGIYYWTSGKFKGDIIVLR